MRKSADPTTLRFAVCVTLASVVAIVAMLTRQWDVAWTSAAVAAVGGMLAARRTAAAGERPRWTWWTAAAAAWLLGQIAWDVFSATGSPPSPNLADAGWFSFALLFMGGLVGSRSTSRTLRLIAVVEALPLIVAATALTLADIWPHAAASALPFSGRASALAYPGLYVSAAVLTLQAMVSGSLRGIRGGGVRFVLAGMVVQAVAFIFWSRQLLDGSYVPGATLIDPLFVLGLIAIAAGGVLAAADARSAEPVTEPGERGGIVPAVTFLLLLAAQVRAGFTSPPAAAHVALSVGLATGGATLIARSALLGRRQLALLEREREARRHLAEREAELARLNERLADDSRRDALTGLRNRRALTEDLGAMGDGMFAVALLDVDHFKAYNDCLGHLAGDNALRALAAIVRGELRAGDTAYRYGGEELLLVLPGATLERARRVAERVRIAVAEATLAHPQGIGGIVTVSIGLAAGRGDAGPLLARADTALYAAKSGGRNRVLGATHGSVPAPAAAPSLPTPETALLRQLRSVIAVSRAAAEGRGMLPVLEAVAEMVRSELRFSTAVVNLRRPDDEFETVVVLGDEEASAVLLGQVTGWDSWAPLLADRHQRCGAYWLPAGSHEWDDSVAVWTPAATADPGPDAWLPEDALLLPLRAGDGRLLGVLAVDEPLSGRRPSDEELTVLMAVADHAGLLMSQLQHQEAAIAEILKRPAADRLAAVLLLAETLDLRDSGTGRHSRTVGTYAREVALALELPADRVERIHAAGILHDLGKLAVPDAVLHKPGPLDDDEWRQIRRHPEIGAEILDHAGLTDIAAWVRAHHERVDGRGYPFGLDGARIPVEARILAAADAYEAMVADRPYRAGMPPDEARAELRRCAGTQFDEHIVDVFLAAIPADPLAVGDLLIH
jgi:diguanylate cyclase (GGDEF)-like protein